jgi:hypothetical protein
LLLPSYFANQAMLVQTAQTTQNLAARQIRYSPGETIERPIITIAGIAIISTLLVIQCCGLAYLTWYIYRVPTWTGLLDAMTIARITNSLDRGAIPAIGSLIRADRDRLGEMNGLIGVVDSGTMNEEKCDLLEMKKIELGLKATGVFDRRLAKTAVQRDERRRTEKKNCQCSGCRQERADTGFSHGTIESPDSPDSEIMRVGTLTDGHGRA